MDVVLEPGLKVLFKSGLFVYNGLRGSDCKKFQQSVDSLLPIVTEICSSSSESSLKLSLQKFQEFRENLDKGIQLVEDHKRSHLLDPRRVKINESVKKLEKSIIEFIQKDLQVVMASAQIYLSTQLETVLGLQHEMVNAQVNLSEGMEAVCERVQAVHRAVVTLGEAVESGVQTGTQIMVETIHQVENNLMSKFEEQRRLCNPPDTPNGFLGFGKHTMNLKKFLLEDGVNVVAVTAMGGAGKSTLAAAVCNDNEIKEYFKEKVIYIEVSESPDLLTILKTMWRKIVGAPTPDFTNVENAHTEMQLKIKSRNQPNQPILVVLDDIWKKPHLEKLLFEEKQYKTLVTTRDEAVIIKEPRTRIYKLQSLQPQYALSLFCHYAFGKTSIPIGRDKKLIEKVQQECNGLPLALKVIGRSLYDESDSVWELAERRLSAGEPIKDDHKESLLNRLETSIHLLDDN